MNLAVPSDVAPGDEEARHPIPPSSRPSSPSILVVDDSAATTRGLGGLLRRAGFTPAAFQQGLAAIDFAERGKPAGAIVDVHLPDISGLVVSQRLRQILGPDVPIVLLSGDTSMEVINSLPHVGATYFFRKPVAGAVLLEQLLRLLRSTGA